MALSLRGNLGTFPITDVLGLLAATNKTGCLRIQSDGGQATLWLRDGTLIAAATERVPGGPVDEAMSDLLRYEDGPFVFEVDDRTPDITEECGPVEDLLDRARAQLAEWEALRVAVPSPDHRVTLTDKLGDEPVTITAGRWPVLAAVAGGCTVAELAVRLGLTELGVLRTVDDLRSLGIASIQTPPASRVGRAIATRLA